MAYFMHIKKIFFAFLYFGCRKRIDNGVHCGACCNLSHNIAKLNRKKGIFYDQILSFLGCFMLRAKKENELSSSELCVVVKFTSSRGHFLKDANFKKLHKLK